ncbi:hypothetical protein CR513_56344, partial [Mucuna pruriens]
MTLGNYQIFLRFMKQLESSGHSSLRRMPKEMCKDTKLGWRVFQLDVKSTFLNDYLEENVCVEQPTSFTIKGQEKKVLKLKKMLYDLKQVPRTCNNRIDKELYTEGVGEI